MKSKSKTNIFDTLKERGYIKQVVFEDDLYKRLGSESMPFYVGFDPTADSLHIGHYIPIMVMAHMQRAGHKPIALIGGATALIGDPSGRTDMRTIMTKETVQSNGEAFVVQMKRFLSFEGKYGAKLVDNSAWLGKLNYLNFLRDVGGYFSVNKMLTADCYKQRLEKGLTFLEFNYMLMQAYDFYRLFEKYGCRLQVGGNDQWSNILAGADLIRRKCGEDAFGLTLTLLETSDGKKMGKTQKGALWLDANKTTPNEFYQYFRNVEDAKVAECLKLLTFLPLDQINEITRYNDQRINEAKKRLAYEVTKLVHGEAAAVAAQNEAAAAFGGSSSDMEAHKISLTKDATVIDLLCECKFAVTKSEARRLIEGGGIRIDDKVVVTVGDTIGQYASGAEFVLSKGKKNRIKVAL
ncbi:MAG: tyrosine--tRNA ligase [Firmicutes bacterium]|nr:tyrosine--tRNA ligase [Bacillota bacterium]